MTGRILSFILIMFVTIYSMTAILFYKAKGSEQIDLLPFEQSLSQVIYELSKESTLQTKMSRTEFSKEVDKIQNKDVSEFKPEIQQVIKLKNERFAQELKNKKIVYLNENKGYFSYIKNLNKEDTVEKQTEKYNDIKSPAGSLYSFIGLLWNRSVFLGFCLFFAAIAILNLRLSIMEVEFSTGLLMTGYLHILFYTPIFIITFLRI